LMQVDKISKSAAGINAEYGRRLAGHFGLRRSY
jgi:hypothetical protein